MFLFFKCVNLAEDLCLKAVANNNTWLFIFQTSLDMDRLIELFRRGFAQTNYSSLCLPENIAARGVESIPNFHYRDDALRLWHIINRYEIYSTVDK